MYSSVQQSGVQWDIRTSNLRHFGVQVSKCLKPFRFLETSPGGYDAAIFRRRLYKLEFLLIRYGNTVTIDAGRLGKMPLLQVPLTGSYRVHHQGAATFIPARTAHLLPADYPLLMEWSDDCLLLVVRLQDDFDLNGKFFRIMSGTAQSNAGSFVDLNASTGASLGHLLDFIIEESVSGKTFTAYPDLARSTEELLMTLLANAFANQGPKQAGPGLSPLLQQAGAYITSQPPCDPLTPALIAKAIGVSPRTLFRHFHDAYGQSPLAWVRDQRLEWVRTDLQNAGQSGLDNRDINITDIAIKHGFNHIGRFAGMYRARFGETPSDTLRTNRLFASRNKKK
jgi:AraC-like DNA-binding protein